MIQHSTGYSTNIGQRQQQLYLIDGDGNIQFPIIGTVKAAGKTKKELINELNHKISKYVIDPVINIRIMNYKFTVQGEVNKPNTYQITSERISLPEAIAMAGDLNIYGQRNNILILREKNGKTTTHRIDITKPDFINSEFYYIKQNDIIYVEPNKVRANSSAVGPNISVAISIVTLLTTVLSLIIR